MGMNMTVYQIVNEYKKLDEVVAITLAGSGASGRKDNFSDIDIDIIVSDEIPVKKREEIIKRFSDDVEVNNTFWGVGDEFILRNTNTQIDIAYFDLNWLKEGLVNVVEKCIANTGYSTCFWHNVVNSFIVYDKDNKFKELQEKYKVVYPVQLKVNIINKNYPILRGNFSAYYNQIEKAIMRKDLVSINHRIAAFLASYFDIIFAINEMQHPGEKRLINIIESVCEKKPDNFMDNITNLLENASMSDKTILESLNTIVDELDLLLVKEKLMDGIDEISLA